MIVFLKKNVKTDEVLSFGSRTVEDITFVLLWIKVGWLPYSISKLAVC